MIWEDNVLLMVDSSLIESESGTSFVREEAYKGTGPLVSSDDLALTLGQRVDYIQARLITRDGSKYKLWYSIHGLPGDAGPTAAFDKFTPIGYAESVDGFHFEPVEVGQVEYRGSKANNLVDFGLEASGAKFVTGLLHDPLGAEFPFKCLYYRVGKIGDFNAGALARWPYLASEEWFFPWGIGRSRDGLTWEPPTQAHNLIDMNPEHAHLHRALDGGMVMSDQMRSQVSELGGREVKGWVSYDEVHAERIPDMVFTLPHYMTRVQAEFSGPNWDGIPWVQPHIGLVCARKGPTVVALHGYLYGAWGTRGAETFAQTADVGLAVSSTGIGFQEVWPFRPFIPRGSRGSWDFGMVCHSAIIDDGDKTRFYYTGNDVGNLGGTYHIGMAWIPRDRYGYRMIAGFRNTTPRNGAAEFSLKCCTLPDRPKIFVNVSHVDQDRTVRLEIQDVRGLPIPGYELENCQPLTEEGLRSPALWANGNTGRDLANRKVRIRVQMRNENCRFVGEDSPRVYAIYLSEEPAKT